MIQVSPGQAGSAPWVHGIWDVSTFTLVYSSDGGESWNGPVTPQPPYPNTYYPALNVPVDGHPWVCYWTITAFDPPTDGLCLGVWRDHATPPSNWAWRGPFLSTDGSAGHVSAVLSSTGGEPMVYAVTSYHPYQSLYQYLMFLAFDTLGNSYSTLLTGSFAGQAFEPTIDYTPGDIVHIAYQKDGQIWYVYSSPITPEQIRSSVPPTWYQPAQPISQGLSAYNRHASIDADGEYVYCSWRGPNAQGQDIGDVRRKWRYVPQSPPLWWPTGDPENVSQSPADESDYPQCGTGTTTTWQEECSEPVDHTEVYAVFPGTGPGRISSDPEFNNLWPQNAVVNPVMPEPWSIYLHALWSQDDLSYPYTDFIHYKRYRYIPSLLGKLEYPTYLKVELGESLPSPYCVEREGCKVYDDARVDFGPSRLRYVLPYLDPSHGYVAECISYNGEKTAITQRVEIGGVMVARIKLGPASCDTFRVVIPRAAYKDTRAKVEVVRESGPFACLANTIKVYEKTERQAGDGQFAGLGGQLQRSVTAAPNPFAGRCHLRLDAGLAASATARIHDASGRLVRTLVLCPEATGSRVASWDGDDESGRAVPAGVYYCRVTSGGFSSSVKVVRR